MPENQKTSVLLGPLADFLDNAVALLSPEALEIVDYNHHFFKRCLLDVVPAKTETPIVEILIDLKLPLLKKAIDRNRIYRCQHTFVQNNILHPVDFVFSQIQLAQQSYILVQGTDNKSA